MAFPLIVQVAVLLGTYVAGEKVLKDGVTPTAAVLGALKASNPLLGAAVGGVLGYTAVRLTTKTIDRPWHKVSEDLYELREMFGDDVRGTVQRITPALGRSPNDAWLWTFGKVGDPAWHQERALSLEAAKTALRHYNAGARESLPFRLAPGARGMEAALTPWQGFARNTRMWGSGREAARINYGVGGTWGWSAYREDGYLIRTGSARTQDQARQRADQVLSSYRPRSTGIAGAPIQITVRS